MVMRFLESRTIQPVADDAPGDVVRMGHLLTLLASHHADDGTLQLDCGPAGTVARFLLGVLAVTRGQFLLTGSDRLRQRPIRPLAEALRSLGAQIEFLDPRHDLPLLVTGRELSGGEVTVDAGISSQFISALMMVAPSMKHGLSIRLAGGLVSAPYVEMTTKLMQRAGIAVRQSGTMIGVPAGRYQTSGIRSAGDWSAAAPWYELVALVPGLTIRLQGLCPDGLQGDEALAGLFAPLGVLTNIRAHDVEISNTGRMEQLLPEISFSAFPDLAQCYLATLAGLNLSQRLTGLQTLRIKETDRIAAMTAGLEAMGARLTVEGDSVVETVRHTGLSSALVHLRDDHRMAFAFAPLAAVVSSVSLDDPRVVGKSYPSFLKHLQAVGFVAG